MVRPFTRLIRNSRLIVEQGRKSFYCINCGSDYALVSAKEDPALYENCTPLLCYTDLLSLGVAAFFVLEFAATALQVFLVCELKHAEWTQTPGSVCLFPQFVPISIVVSELSPPSTSVRSFTSLVPSDGHFGCHPSRCPLDGMMKFSTFFVGLGTFHRFV